MVTFLVSLYLFKGDGLDFLVSTDAWLGAGECRTFGLTALVGIAGLVPFRCTDFFSFGLNTFQYTFLLDVIKAIYSFLEVH